MFVKLRPRRSTKAEWDLIDPILKEGEFCVEVPDTGVGTGLCKFKIGDGYRRWSELPYAFNAEAAEAIYGGNVFISHDICLRSGTSDDWETENPVLKMGEIAYDVTKIAFKVGDGEHPFNELQYIGYSWEMDAEYDFGDIDDGIIIPTADDKDYDFGDIDQI